MKDSLKEILYRLGIKGVAVIVVSLAFGILVSFVIIVLTMAESPAGKLLVFVSCILLSLIIGSVLVSRNQRTSNAPRQQQRQEPATPESPAPQPTTAEDPGPTRAKKGNDG